MLRRLNKEVSECYARAESCAREAAEATTEGRREDLLRLQESWLTLALSYEFANRLEDFSKENSRRRAELYGNGKPEHRALSTPCEGQGSHSVVAEKTDGSRLGARLNPA
jgi:hypothetical protein